MRGETRTEYAMRDPEGQVWWCFATTDRERLERQYEGRRWTLLQRERTHFWDDVTEWSEAT